MLFFILSQVAGIIFAVIANYYDDKAMYDENG